MSVAKDGTVEVQLDSNPTTGYTWRVAPLTTWEPTTHARTCHHAQRPVAQSPGTARRGWRSRRGPQGIVLRRALTSSRRLACPSLHACRTLASGSNGLEQTGSQYISKSEGGMVGGGGIQTYTFKAAGQGENTLEFVYKVRRGLVCVRARARARVCQSIVSVDG